jgi:uncharacterized protein (DUF2141 family)
MALSAAAHAPDTAAGTEHGTIRVVLTGFENDRGSAKLSLCRTAEELRDFSAGFRAASAAITGKQASWVFEHIPYGRYSIKAFHDENGNSKLTTNFAGMPVERYGFSNNARGRLGPPSFDAAAFTLNTPQMTVEIELK